MSGSGTKDDPWQLSTPPGTSSYSIYRDDSVEPPILVCVVGKTTLTYQARCLDDLHAMLVRGGGLGAARRRRRAEARAGGIRRGVGPLPDNPVGGWYGLKKGLRGRFGVYIPPLMEELGLAELEHNPRNNRMRADLTETGDVDGRRACLSWAACAWSRCCRRPPRSSTRSASATIWSGSPSSATSRLPPGGRRPSWSAAGTPSGMAPGEIDEYVQPQLAAGADLYTLHADALAGLDPDLILTQDLCRVCALPSGQVDDALDYLGCRADVLSLDPHSLDDVLDASLLVGDRTGTGDRAGAWSARCAPGSPRSPPPSPIGRDRGWRSSSGWTRRSPPGTGCPTWSGRPAASRSAADPGSGRCRPRGRVRRGRPDVVIVAPCGFHLDGAAAQAERSPPHLPGVPVWAIDADGIVVRPGPRLVDGVEAIAAILHPDAVPVSDAIRLVDRSAMPSDR